MSFLKRVVDNRFLPAPLGGHTTKSQHIWQNFTIPLPQREKKRAFIQINKSPLFENSIKTVRILRAFLFRLRVGIKKGILRKNWRLLFKDYDYDYYYNKKRRD